MSQYTCQNCDFTADESQFVEAKDLAERHAPGDVFSDVECPKCGALAQPSSDMEPADKKWIELARQLYAVGSDNDIEIDDNAKVSRGNGGAFVQAWVYVRDSEMGLEEDEPVTDEERSNGPRRNG